VDVRIFVAIAVTGAALALLTRGRERLSLGVGLAGLLACLAAALVLDEAASSELLGSSFGGTGFLRLFLVLGCLTGLAACLMALATRWHPDLPAATLAALGGSGLALSLGLPPVAFMAAMAAGALGLLALATARSEVEGRSLTVPYLQALVGAGGLAIVASAWLIGRDGPVTFDSIAGGTAALAMGLALAVRLGAVPFHAATARVVQAAIPLGIPLLLAWLPAVVFLVALTWSQRVLLAQEVVLADVRVPIAVVGAATLVLGALGVLGRPSESDDAHVIVSYGIVQDAGLFLLAFAAFDPAAWEPARVWAVYFVLSKTVLAAWMAALIAVRGGALLGQLEGWARSSPLLAVALVAAVLVGLGIPGLGPWDARLGIIHAVAERPLRWTAYAGWGLAYLPFARLLWVGLRSPGPALPEEARLRLALPPERPTWRDLRAVSGYLLRAAQGSRHAIATLLLLILAASAGWLAVTPDALVEAAAGLPEPLLPPPSPAP
jgi:NADH:ubiquinone oxidoreductase subunit 2 (subunit N)